MSEQTEQETKMVEIWIRGRKLCTIPEDTEAVEFLEQIVRQAGYSINEKTEDNKTIKMI